MVPAIKHTTIKTINERDDCTRSIKVCTRIRDENSEGWYT